jgi:Pyruvate/2-oxoacid:ferredoxin oxidoreductase delta subunit
MVKKIIQIDEARCVGCGACAAGCHQSAIKIINGKAKLTDAVACDGLGMCIGKCPHDAITFVEKDVVITPKPMRPACNCPGTMAVNRKYEPVTAANDSDDITVRSQLRQWPVELKLLNPAADYFDDCDLLVAADCVAYAYADFHRKMLKGKTLAILCPKLDSDLDAYVEKLAEILKSHTIKSIMVARMMVPCCGGTTAIVQNAIQVSGVCVPL